MREDLGGVFAGVPTPVRDDGSLAGEELDRIVDFLIGAGIDGLCVGGVTGEYAAYSLEDRTRIIRRVAARNNGRVPLIVGIGAETEFQVMRSAEVALDCGAVAALFPPPAYFRYEAEDLAEAMRHVSSRLPLPGLLYNIPQYTNQLDFNHLVDLVESVPKIIGIKDSSGNRETLTALWSVKRCLSMVWMIGSDGLLLEGLKHGADGTISGSASACPELILAIDKAYRAGRMEQAGRLQAMLAQFVARISGFPTPWGIKLAMDARGFHMGPLPWPVNEQMISSISEFQVWFATWINDCLRVLSSGASGARRSGMEPKTSRSKSS